jgi:hypothetical protein
MTVFTDNFNRSDAALEASPTLSGGGTWTHDGTIAGAAIISSNQLANNTTDAAGSLYSVDVGSADQYLQYTVVDTTGNAFLAMRAEHRVKLIGVRVSGSNFQVWEIPGFSNAYNVDHGFVSGDVAKVILTGTGFTIYKNGVLQGGGSLSGSFTGTRVGIHVRQAIQNPWIDNFEAGTIGPPYADTFNRSNANLESSATASGGWAWTHDAAISGGAAIDGNQLRCNTSASGGTAYLTPDGASLNQYVQFKVVNNDNGMGLGPYAALRYVDINNFIGIRYGAVSSVAGHIDVRVRVGGTFTILYLSASGTEAPLGAILRLEVDGTGVSGDAWRVYSDGVLKGSGTIGAALNATRQGLVPRSLATNPWLDDFEAGVLSAGSGVSVTTTSPAMTIAAGTVAVTVNRVFTDTFNRSDANLEASATASGGWTWTHDGLISGAATISSNALSGNTTNTTGSAYKTPDLATTSQYVQYKATTVTNTTGPFAALRLADRNNFIGIRQGNEGTGTGVVVVYRRVAGSLAALYTSPLATVAVNDVIRLEAVGSFFRVLKNGTELKTWTEIGAVFASTHSGVVARTTVASYFDDMEFGALTVSSVYADNFNRANANLESSPTASGGWNWTHDGVAAGALAISSNGLSCGISAAPSSAYWTPPLASSNHYVQWVVPSTSPTQSLNSSGVVCRYADKNNYLVAVVNNNAGTGTLRVSQQVGGSFTTHYNSNANPAVAGDTIRLECVGTAWTLKKNGSTVSSGTFSSALTASRCAVHAHDLVGPVCDDFEAGVIESVSVTTTSPAMSMIAGPAGATVNSVFTDNFNRADQYLSSSPGWVYWGGNPLTIAAVRSNALASLASGGDFGVQYNVPNPGSRDQYIQFKLAQVGTPQSLVVARSSLGDNFVGILNAGTSIVVLRFIDEVSVTLATYTGAAAVNDIYRMELVGDFVLVLRNGSPLGPPVAIGHTHPGTNAGVIFYGNTTNPFIDDWESGPIVLSIGPHADSFNRSNADLEASATASGGWTWTHDGAISGALSIVSNQLRNNTADAVGSAYKSPDTGDLNQYVQFKALNVTALTGPFVCLRLADRNNFVGIRVGSSAFGGGELEVYLRNSGTFTALYNSSASNEIAENDLMRFEVSGTGVSGDAWRVYKNGALIRSGSNIVAAMTSTRQGLVARALAFQPWIDDYEAGALSVSDVITASAALGISVGTVSVTATSPAISQAGSILQWSVTSTANTGTVSSTITVPAEAKIIVVGVSAQQGTNSGLAAMTFTKGGVDTAMTKVAADGSNANWQGAIFWLALPDTGDNKTLKWDWIGSGTSSVDRMNFSATFWAGVDTTSPVRSSGGGQMASALANLTCITTDKVVAFMAMRCPAANGSGTIDGWNNLTELANITHNAQAEGVWAVASPTGNITCHGTASSNIDEAAFAAVTLVLGAPSAVNVSVTVSPTTALSVAPYAAVSDLAAYDTITYGTRANTILTPQGGAGDLQAAILFIRPTGTGTPPTVTPPGGWTSMWTASSVSDGATTGTLYGWSKFRAVGDSSYTFTHTSAQTSAFIGGIARAAGTIDAQSHNSGTSGISMVATAIVTDEYPNEELLFVGHDWTSASHSPPAGFTELLDGQPLYIASKDLTALGDTGSASVTSGASSSPWQAKLLAFVPAGVSIAPQQNASISVTMSALAITNGGVGNPISFTVSMEAMAAATSTPTVLIPTSVNAATNLLTMATSTPSVVGKATATLTTTPALGITAGDVTVALTGAMSVLVDLLPALAIDVGHADTVAPTLVDVSGNFMVSSVGTAVGSIRPDVTVTAMPALASAGGGAIFTGQAIVYVTGEAMSALLGGNGSVEGDAAVTTTGTSLSMAMALGNESVTIGSNAIVADVPAMTITAGTADSIAIAFVTVNVTAMPALAIRGGNTFVSLPGAPSLSDRNREGQMLAPTNWMGA